MHAGDGNPTCVTTGMLQSAPQLYGPQSHRPRRGTHTPLPLQPPPHSPLAPLTLADRAAIESGQ